MTAMTAPDYETIVAARDDGADRDRRPPRPCCKRIGHAWCIQPDGRVGDCVGVNIEEARIGGVDFTRGRGKR